MLGLVIGQNGADGLGLLGHHLWRDPDLVLEALLVLIEILGFA